MPEQTEPGPCSCPTTADLWLGVAPSGPADVSVASGGTTWNLRADAPDPFRLLLDQFTANAVQATRAKRVARHDETRQAHHDVAAVWTQAAHLLSQTIKQANNSGATPEETPS